RVRDLVADREDVEELGERLADAVGRGRRAARRGLDLAAERVEVAAGQVCHTGVEADRLARQLRPEVGVRVGGVSRTRGRRRVRDVSAEVDLVDGSAGRLQQVVAPLIL